MKLRMWCAAAVLASLFGGEAAAQTYAPGSNEYFITSTYFGVLGRAPDASGWVWWVNQANMGTSWLDVLADNLNSQEYANKFGAPDNTAFVTLLYQNAFLRQPDPGGLAFWIGFLDNGSLTRSQVAEYNITSDEFNVDQTNGTALSAYGTTAVTYHSAYAVPAVFTFAGNGAAESEQVLTVNYTDTDGPPFVASGQVIVGSSSGPSGSNTCYILWDNSGNLTLAGDPLYPNNISGKVGGPVMTNSYCSLKAGSTTLGVSADGQTYAAVLHLIFYNNQIGTHEVWSSALNTAGLTSGYVALGTLAIRAAAPANLLQPTDGAAATVGQPVTYQMYGYEADNWTSDNALLILQIHPTSGTPVNFASSCSVQYKPAANMVYLVNDSASGVTSGVPGSSAVLSNSQCTVDLSKTSASNSSGSVTVTVPVTFTARYAGPRYDDIALYENQTSNWFYFGTIMISPTEPWRSTPAYGPRHRHGGTDHNVPGLRLRAGQLDFQQCLTSPGCQSQRRRGGRLRICLLRAVQAGCEHGLPCQ